MIVDKANFYTGRISRFFFWKTTPAIWRPKDRATALDNNDFDATLAKGFSVGGAYAGIGDHPVNVFRFAAEGQTVASEFAGIDDDGYLLRQFDQAQGDLSPENVRRSQTGIDIEGVCAQEQVVHIEVAQGFQGMWAIQGA